MHLLGYPSAHKKGYFVDGHERTDVVRMRDIFCAYIEKVESRMRDFTGDNRETEVLPVLREGEREVVLITHDECIFYANDGNFFIYIYPNACCNAEYTMCTQ
jgi:hypothetical protein